MIFRKEHSLNAFVEFWVAVVLNVMAVDEITHHLEVTFDGVLWYVPEVHFFLIYFLVVFSC